jgi:hypothetical protein
MTVEHSGETGLKKKRITLKDGRYMILYTFEDQPAPAPEDSETARPTPDPKPASEDEGSV